jgi:aspartate racemase
MLVDPVANVIPVYDTTALHSEAAVDWILGEDAAAQPQEFAAAGNG